MPRPIPPQDCIALTWLRERIGWTQIQLAQAVGTTRTLISDYERNNRPLSSKRLKQLAAAMAYSPSQIDLILLAIAALGPDTELDHAPAADPAAQPPAEARLHRHALACLATEVVAFALPNLRHRLVTRQLELARGFAAELWRRLVPASAAERRLLIQGLVEFQSWALAERLAHESERAVSANAPDALDLAQLAVTAARLVAGTDAWRCRIEGYARAYLANALQAAGNRAAAEVEGRSAWCLWQAGTSGDPTGILAERPLLDLPESMNIEVPRVAPAPDDKCEAPLLGAESSTPLPAEETEAPASAGSGPRPCSQRIRRIALIWLRERIAWTHQDLASVAGCHRSHISGFERGPRPLTRQRLEFLASLMGYASSAIDLAVRTVLALGDNAPIAGHASAAPAIVAPQDGSLLHRSAAHLAVEVTTLAQPRLAARSAARRIASARAAAENQWKVLASLTPGQRQVLVESLLEFHGWALAERLGEESRSAAPRSAATAEELARLGVKVARLAAGSEAWRSRLEGYARAFLANALRVQGSLAQADGQWRMVWRLWHAGAEGDPTAILPEWRLLDLEASLRRDAGNFDAALDLLDRTAVTAPRSALGRILLNRAFALELAGDATAAVAALREAAPLVAETGDLRLKFAMEFTLTAVLCRRGAFAEAAAQIPSLRKLSIDLTTDLDVLRVSWLAARVAAGMGDREEAVAGFEFVHKQFAARGNGIAAARVSLELALIYLAEGRLAEVRQIAQAMRGILVAQGVEHEALASLTLFCEAASREVATIQQARTALRLLARSPGLPFSPP